MTLTEDQRLQLERLCKKFRIHFYPQLLESSLSQEQRRIFNNIRRLGATKYGDYAVESTQQSEMAPWKLEAKELALQLTEVAQRCRRRNEASWRHACEPLVFARVNSDVACANCRQRLWRSEIEAARHDGSRAAVSLQRRQQDRRPCRCPRYFRNLDRHENKGLSRIFTHREEDQIIHSGQIEKELPRHERPDRVYGLRETRNLETLLYSQARVDAISDRRANGGELVLDLINVSPYSLEGEPLLFPFLFLEAKSGLSPDDWHSIKLQTCFPIRTALEIQRGLQTANGTSTKWEARPLVWFLMSKGEDWRLCSAFTTEGFGANQSDSTMPCRILDLWNGSILTKDGALQLILLVDYIFDWARDEYRPAILEEVQLLAADIDAVGTFIPDTDIFSTRETVFQDLPADTMQANNEEFDRLMDHFRDRDSSYGIIRHAAFIESKFRMLFITRDNIDTLLRSIQEDIAQTLARRVLTQMAKHPLNIGLDTLDAIEELWTGNTRLSQPFNLTDTSFYAVITYAAYMKPSWEQVRELYVVAIAKDAFQPLVDFSGLRPWRGKTRVPVSPPIETEAISKTISSIRDTCRLSTLEATISRVHKRLGSSVVTPGDTGFIADNGEFWDVIQHMYIYFKKGTFEPSEPFFRVSQRFERIQTQPSRIKPLQQDDSNAAPILVHGTSRWSDGMRSKQSDICIFLLQDPIKVPDNPTLARMLKETFENYDVYHTTRDNGTSNPKTKVRPPWNLENTYGIYALDREFVRWITYLGSSPPTRQGSPRDSVLSGRYLLRRCYSPWTDVRRPYSGKSFRLYMIYKIMTTEIRYWTDVAKQQRRAGISCCRCCAATDRLVQHDVPGDDAGPKRLEICEDCEGELWVPNHPRWVSDALMGKRRIRWRPLRNFIFHGDDGEPIHHPAEPLRVLQRSERWYRKLSNFRGLEKPFRDMSELHDQAESYHVHRSGKSKPRPRRSFPMVFEEHRRGFMQRDSRDKDIYTSDEGVRPNDVESDIRVEESGSGNREKNATK